MAHLCLLFVLCVLIAQTQANPHRSQSTKSTYNHCPKGWTQLDNYCYIYQSHYRIFADAESVCNIIGGNLVSINSAKENALVLELIREGAGSIVDTWIGLTDAIEEGDFMWTDGEIVNFRDFADHQPDNGNGGDEDCVEIESRDDMWHDVPCTDENPFVCIRPVDKKDYH
ncbi:lithostathine-1-alpha-like isoform X2 [Corythoichthys intestinalis]|nr:lithostathine-1-alpha-like isoform X2 [Corythoichthys intestinalis]